jgi:glycosyltransferase involved in cell wall biosynthesis
LGVDIEISVAVPVKNEAGNIEPLVREILAALRGQAFEIVYVDDGSSDGTAGHLLALRKDVPELRIVQHDRTCGQSQALRTAITAARGSLVVTIDGDGQNDPADIPALIEAWRQGSAGGDLGLVAGQRRKRQDKLSKRLASRFANALRRRALKDDTQDTGCGLKLIPRAVYLRLPYFDHMHRYLPALVKREGLKVAFVSVNHRPRRHGRSNYGNLDRALVSIRDLMGVMWLLARCRLPAARTEL